MGECGTDVVGRHGRTRHTEGHRPPFGDEQGVRRGGRELFEMVCGPGLAIACPIVRSVRGRTTADVNLPAVSR
jgi:hypothetical protein